MYQMNEAERTAITTAIEKLIQENAALHAQLQQQQTNAASANNSLFLELLGVVDALDYLCSYLAANPEPPPAFQARLPNSLRSIANKLETSLANCGVTPIEVPLNVPPDFQTCAAVSREIRPDLPPQTVLKVSRRGFYAGDAILRPAEVVVASPE